MMDSMKVWVVEKGSYEDRRAIGAYASIEAVIAAHPTTQAEEQQAEKHPGSRTGGWMADPDDPDSWWNGLDWEASVTATAYEMQEGTA